MMGVSGCGKSTIGIALAERLNGKFFDGDDFHPPENIVKMSAGIPLNDEDRAPWLAALNQVIHEHLAVGAIAVVACSALKRSYRDQLRQGNPELRFVYLKGNFDLIWSRMKSPRTPLHETGDAPKPVRYPRRTGYRGSNRGIN